MLQGKFRVFEKSLKFFSISAKMRIQGCVALSLIISSLLLTGCISEVWTGATLVYDRHHVYKKISDFQLGANTSNALYHDKTFKREDCDIEIAVLNGDILLVGHVPTMELREDAYTRVANVPGKRRLFKQLTIKSTRENPILDSWITAKIRSQMFANADIDPKAFKIVTVDQIVYLMGDVVPSQAEKVILFARECVAVKRVVKLFKYFNLSDRPI